VALGEDIRAGRWRWEEQSAKECGLHFDAHLIVTKNTETTA
jgi:3'-phosphoadenosine 5'-phosphosulfate sulfotransferase (PAPS reductase)/FAD synthetase